MRKMVGLLLVLLIVPMLAFASTSDCSLQSSQCVSNSCETITDPTTNNSVCVCVSGTSPVPAGCIVDSSTSCWQYSNTYQCYSSAQTNTCSSSQIQGCTLDKSTCSQTDTSGNCVAWAQTWICPNQATTSCSPSTPGSNCTAGSTNCLQTVDTTCTDQTTNYTCAAPPAYCNTDPNCTYTSQTCTDTVNGQCDTVQQTYTCTSTTQTCAQTGTTSSCTGVQTYGYENQSAQPGDNGFSQAEQDMALLDALKKNIGGDPPAVFAGQLYTCKQTVGCQLGNCCCDTNVGKSGYLWTCNTTERQLGALRRSDLAVQVASGCADGIKDPFGSGCDWCTAQEYWYCGFDSLLGKLVQVQGRQQLAAMAANGYAGATQTPITFAYYGTGGWQGPWTVNGNTVWAYQWPSACDSNTTAPPSGTSCPSDLEVWFAACDGTSGCTTPSYAPPSSVPSGDTAARVLSTGGSSQPLSRYVVATGTCDSGTGQCAYTLSAWPGGNGGTAMLNIDLGWALYGGTAAGWSAPTSAGNYSFEGQVMAFSTAGGTAPTGIGVQYSSDSGSTWNSVTLPLSVTADQSVTLPGTQISVYGRCDATDSWQCDYHFVAPATAVAKPWVISQSSSGCSTSVTADCSGFSLSEFALLDLGKMNLSEWTATLTSQNQATTNLSNSATADTSSATSTESSLAVNAPVYTSQQTPTTADSQSGAGGVLQLSASECEVGTNCSLTAQATSNWTQTYASSGQNTNPVQSVTLDWGDGTTDTLTTPQLDSGSGLMLFTDNHTYSAAGTYPVTATFTMPDGSTHVASAQVQAYTQSQGPPVNQTQQSATGGANIIPSQ